MGGVEATHHFLLGSLIERAIGRFQTFAPTSLQMALEAGARTHEMRGHEWARQKLLTMASSINSRHVD